MTMERTDNVPKVDEKGLKKTPLYDYYLEQGLKLTDFGGWALPIQITKLADEHEAVRERVGLFDCAHMGEIRISGEHAFEFVNGIITNDATKLANQEAMYTAITNEKGGILDDVIFYKEAEDSFLFTPNAANTEKILNWFKKHNVDNRVKIEDLSDEYGLIAIQGPKSEAVLEKLTDADLGSISDYAYLPNQSVAEIEGVAISRTGYTGETGFELYVPFDHQLLLWKKLLEAGEEFGMLECALGARDTLRLEAAMPLYGNDLSEDINPFEGGIGFTVKTGAQKEQDYPGKTALEEHKVKETKRISRGFELKERGIARPGMVVRNANGDEIGTVTSGTMSPTFKKALGYVLIDNTDAKIGDEVFIEVRKKLVPAEIVKKDWLRRK